MTDDKLTQAIYLGTRDAIAEYAKGIINNGCLFCKVAVCIEIILFALILWRVW